MPLYEHTVIARQDLSAQQAQALTDALSQLVTDNGGSVVKVESWGLRNLAYRIHKSRKGHYIHLGLDASPAVIQELERTQRYNEDVLRFMTVKVDEVTEEPSPVMQARVSRDDRGRRDRGERGDRDRGDRGDRDRGDRDRDRGDRFERSESGERAHS
jgi:small subunit ribosomal protein S6